MPIPQTEIEKKRAAWWAEHYKPGMSLSEVFRLNEEVIGRFPKPLEEREQKAKDWEGVPQFIL